MVRKFKFSSYSLLAFVKLLGSLLWAAGQATEPAWAASLSTQDTEKPQYTVKHSEIVLPDDVPLGQYRRVTQPFPNWTLICDENLVRQEKVCNISQTILDGQGGSAFSWSLAAAEDGRPFFILRVPSMVGKGGVIQMKLPDNGADVFVPVEGCNANVCVAYQQVGPRLRLAVEKGDMIGISYAGGSPERTISFVAPLEGLDAALSAI